MPRVAVVLLMSLVGAAVLHASDPTAIFARVDRVVLAPGDASPDTIQVWGVFSIASPRDPNGYLAPARGYLYFTLPGNKEQARREWADLKEVAGTKRIVSFGSRWEMHARLRGPEEPAKDPDAYVLGTGVHKIQGSTEYPPIRALIDFKN